MSEPKLKKRGKANRQDPRSIVEATPANGSTGHAIADFAGIFADDPLWDEYMEEIQKARAEADAADPWLMAAREGKLEKEQVQGDVPDRDEHD